MSRMGDTSDATKQATEKLTDTAQQMGQNLRDLGGQVREAAREKYEQYGEQARQYVDQGRHAAEDWEQNLESYIKEKPVQALAIAAGVGLLLGLLWKRS